MPKNSPSAVRLLEVDSIGRKLRTLRTQKHLTLSRLAAETGFSTALLCGSNDSQDVNYAKSA